MANKMNRLPKFQIFNEVRLKEPHTFEGYDILTIKGGWVDKKINQYMYTFFEKGGSCTESILEIVEKE